MKKIVPGIVLCCLSACFLLISQAVSAQNDYLFQTDGTVRTSVIKNDTLYIGGDFNYVGRYHGNCVKVEGTNGSRMSDWPVFNGEVYSIIPDGANGYYVGGTFDSVGGIYTSRIAHINSDNSVDPDWHIEIEGSVMCLLLSGNTLYAGGGILSVDGMVRNRGASINITSRTVNGWNPNANDCIFTMAKYGSTILAGGIFSSIGGQTRNLLAALDETSGIATGWNPGIVGRVGSPASGSIDDIVVKGDSIFVSGVFARIGTQPRTNIGGINGSSGAHLAWTPILNGRVYDLERSGDTIFVAGGFSTVNGMPRKGIAALDCTKNSNFVMPWTVPLTAAADETATGFRAKKLSDGLLYVSYSVFSATRPKEELIISCNTTTGIISSWNPNPINKGPIRAIIEKGVDIIFGGAFTSINGYRRNNAAAIDLNTNSVTSWNPQIIGSVYSILPHGNTIYTGGQFITAGGQPRSNIAAYDAITGLITDWDPMANGIVRTMALSTGGSIIYAGGSFSYVGGEERNNIVALDIFSTTDIVTDWNPDANGLVKAIAIRPNGEVVVCGEFTSIGGQLRNYIAALDPLVNTNNATDWNPAASNLVNTLVITPDNKVIAGGIFTWIGGKTRNMIVSLNADGTASDWEPDMNNEVTSLTLLGPIVYVTGNFNTVNGSPRQHIAALYLNRNTDNLMAWNPLSSFYSGSSNILHTVAATNNRVFVGGEFTYSYNDGRATSNYYLTFLPGQLSVLPLHLQRFAVREDDKKIIIDWRALDIDEGTVFEVQRSAGNLDFVTIGTRSVDVHKPFAAFTVYDKNLPAGTYFYRLKITEPSGTTRYSETKVINIERRGKILPSVVDKNQSFIINIPVGDAVLYLYDRAGRLCLRQQLRQGSQLLSITELKKGEMYFYALRNGNGQAMETGRLLVR